MKTYYLLIISLLTFFVFILQSKNSAQAQTFEGDGTFYQYYGGGNCSFPYPGMLTAAMNQQQYNTAGDCGACIVVTHKSNQKSVLVRIDDRCPECAYGDVDLVEDAFVKIAQRWEGRIPISWRYVPCPNVGNLVLYFKEGSSQWWTAVQVRDSRYRIAKFAYKPSNSSSPYKSLPRQMYNYFLASGGMGPGPYDIQITDVNGQVVRLYNIPLRITTPIRTNKQFPLMPGAMTEVANSLMVQNQKTSLNYQVIGQKVFVMNEEEAFSHAKLTNLLDNQNIAMQREGKDGFSFNVLGGNYYLLQAWQADGKVIRQKIFVK